MGIKAYDGKSDPQNHLDHFNNLMELHLVSELAKCRVFAVTLTRGAKRWFRFIPTGSVTSWQQLSTSFLQHFQATRKTTIPLAHLGNVKQKKGETLKPYINRFNEMSNFMIWSLDAGILAYPTNGVLSKTPFWDKLQQKECQSIDEFCKKTHKYLKVEDSREALRKIEGMTTDKKNDLGVGVKGQKGQDKRRGEDKRARSPKKWKNKPVENKGPLLKYTNYHSLMAPLDHIYAIMDRNLYKPLEPMKGDRFHTDIKRNCAFHKDIEHTTDKCVAFKDKIKRLIKADYFKEFVDKPQAANREERPRQQSSKRVREVLTIIGGLHLAKKVTMHAKNM